MRGDGPVTACKHVARSEPKQAPAVIWVPPQGCPNGPPLVALLGLQLKEPVSVLLGPSALLCQKCC